MPLLSYEADVCDEVILGSRQRRHRQQRVGEGKAYSRMSFKAKSSKIAWQDEDWDEETSAGENVTEAPSSDAGTPVSAASPSPVLAPASGPADVKTALWPSLSPVLAPAEHGKIDDWDFCELPEAVESEEPTASYASRLLLCDEKPQPQQWPVLKKSSLPKVEESTKARVLMRKTRRVQEPEINFPDDDDFSDLRPGGRRKVMSSSAAKKTMCR
mmetsp:Transcript_5591/g.9981  ORF Transcript_5591/g.9981 Transcript_5591/m.9981 type:complete len:214 (-) Transcript_5591:40-681(-)